MQSALDHNNKQIPFPACLQNKTNLLHLNHLTYNYKGSFGK